MEESRIALARYRFEKAYEKWYCQFNWVWFFLSQGAAKESIR